VLAVAAEVFCLCHSSVGKVPVNYVHCWEWAVKTDPLAKSSTMSDASTPVTHQYLGSIPQTRQMKPCLITYSSYKAPGQRPRWAWNSSLLGENVSDHNLWEEAEIQLGHLNPLPEEGVLRYT
jgi:hypothetical protein